MSTTCQHLVNDPADDLVLEDKLTLHAPLPEGAKLCLRRDKIPAFAGRFNGVLSTWWEEERVTAGKGNCMKLRRA